MFPMWYLWLGIIILGVLAWVLWLWIGKRMVRTHRVAILATAIPQALLAISFVVLYLLTLGGTEKEALQNIWVPCVIASLSLAGAAFLSSIVFAIMHKWEIAKGIGHGGGIGFVVSVVAFFGAFALYG